MCVYFPRSHLRPFAFLLCSFEIRAYMCYHLFSGLFGRSYIKQTFLCSSVWRPPWSFLQSGECSKYDILWLHYCKLVCRVMSLLVLGLPFPYRHYIVNRTTACTLQQIWNERPDFYTFCQVLYKVTWYLSTCQGYLQFSILLSNCFAGNVCFFKKDEWLTFQLCIASPLYIRNIYGKLLGTILFLKVFCGDSAQYMNQYPLKK